MNFRNKRIIIEIFVNFHIDHDCQFIFSVASTEEHSKDNGF